MLITIAGKRGKGEPKRPSAAPPNGVECKFWRGKRKSRNLKPVIGARQSAGGGGKDRTFARYANADKRFGGRN